MVAVYFGAIVLVYRRMTFMALLISLGTGAITSSLTDSLFIASAAALFALFAMVALVPREGFVDVTAPLDPSLLRDARKVRASTYENFTSAMPRYNSKHSGRAEGFTDSNTNTSPSDISKIVSNMTSLGFGKVFIDVAQNIAKNTNLGKVGSPSKSIEGYEDVKKEKNETPAPAIKDEKDTMGEPFKLGEIPTQVKNGPHIDAGSTLMQAIKGLNPDQINAMTNDTKQLIETQKSLMGMLGNMKPMLNDGKQLMDTFQQMFGQSA